MKAQAKFRHVAFYELLADAVFQHQLAARASESYAMNRYARASILASVLSMECVANCLLYSLDLPAPLHSELDKLPVLAKIETFLKVKSIITFDRGRSEVQKVVELIKARNDYIHPKVTSIKVDVQTPQDAGADWLVPMSLHYQRGLARINLRLNKF